MLAYWNNSSWVDMSLHSHTLSWFLANQSLLILLWAVCLAEKQQIPTWVFSLIRPWLESTIYHTQSEQANNYTTDVVSNYYIYLNHIYSAILATLQITLYALGI